MEYKHVKVQIVYYIIIKKLWYKKQTQHVKKG